MKKLSLLLSAAFLILPLFGLQASAAAATGVSPPVEPRSQGVYLYNIDTESLIYEKNSGEKMYPASLTKIMTCILALEQTDDLDNEILTYPNYIQDYLYDYQYIQGHGRVSSGGLMAREQLPMREMLYALMLPSANEAAMIIADHIAGSQDEFAAMMNTRARQLGATSTNFVNPNGLFDAGHYTTPEDMAKITLHALQLPGFQEIVSSTVRTYGPTNLGQTLTWNTTNYMMLENNTYYYPGLKGVKTGTLPESGRCFISTATRDGFTYLLVLMNAPSQDADGVELTRNMAFEDAGDLYDWVFSTFKRKTLVNESSYETEISLRLSLEKDYLQLITAERFSALVPSDVEISNIKKDYDLPDSVDAPVQKGDFIGTVTLKFNNEVLGQVDLLAGETVPASTSLVILQRIRNVLGSFWFKFTVIFILLLAALYTTLMILRNRRRRRQGGYRPRRRI